MMPSWNNLLNDVTALPNDAARTRWLIEHQNDALREIGRLRGNRHVILYGSAFLQKPSVPAEWLWISPEDLNGLMSVIYGMDWSRGLTLILHTPGGRPDAAESLVAYLRSKFEYIEVIVPTLAMSAGTMISLAANLIVMGRQSQLGPIDPQMSFGPGRSISARAVVEQFERAKDEILKNVQTAHVWAPITQSLGPSLLQESQNALDYSESTVAKWLSQYMFHERADAEKLGKEVAHHFNDASKHKSHGRRIDRDEARANNVNVEDLEADQSLQEAVLTSYHLMTISFEKSQGTKMLWSDTAQTWIKNFAPPGTPAPTT
jgi:hypothetical protein